VTPDWTACQNPGAAFPLALAKETPCVAFPSKEQLNPHPFLLSAVAVVMHVFWGRLSRLGHEAS